MLDDGLFTRFPKPDVGFALHDGAVCLRLRQLPGRASAHPTADGLYIKFKGRGGHGAMPQTTIDPVMMASRFVVDVQSVDQPRKGPDRIRRGLIGAIHGGTARQHHSRRGDRC